MSAPIEYERTGRSLRAQDLVEMADELRALEKIAWRRGGNPMRYFNARWYLKQAVKEAAARIIGNGCDTGAAA